MKRNLRPSDYSALLQLDFGTFIQRCFEELNPQTALEWNWHLDLVAAKLEACRRGDIKRLIILVPPRHLKSHCASIALPAWWLAHNPAAQIICVSYAQDLADKLARDCRTVMASSFYKRAFGTRLSRDRQAVHEFTTTAQGWRFATSVGGVLTGRGADVILIDDPLKPDEAVSEAQRSAVNDWYDRTLYSRLNDKQHGSIVLIMQRLHEDDLVAHVLAQEAWDVVSLPAIAEEDQAYRIDTVLGTYTHVRRTGELLHPKREPRETLARIRSTIGEYNFAGQYQQTPAPLGGGLIKSEWFRIYETPPEKFDQIVQSWDTANKPTELADYSVCTTWGLKDKHAYLLNVFRKRLNYPELKRAVHEQWRAFGAQVILIEDKASGTQLIQELVADGVHAVTKYSPEGDKIMRVHAQTATIENGFVHLPQEAHWRAEYIHEVTTFPRGKYDDQVDSTAQALDWIKRASLSSASGWIEFYRLMAEGPRPNGGKVRLKAPIGMTPGVSQIYVGKGPAMTVGSDGTLEVTEEQAALLSQSGWAAVI